MLSSNFLDDVLKFSEFTNSRCYKQIKRSLRSENDHSAIGQSVTHVKQPLQINTSRTNVMSHRLPYTKLAQKRQRTLSPHSISPVILFFIVLLSYDQTTTVNGALSRDSFISVYQNKYSVNNITNADLKSSSEIDANVVTLFDDQSPIIEYFKNVSDDVGFDRLLSDSRKSKQPTIYQNEFAVYIPSGNGTADHVADKYGFSNMGQVS